MGWHIDSKQIDGKTVTTVWFPEEKKEAVYKNGKLEYVTVNGLKVKFTDGVHPDPGGVKKGNEIVVGDDARKAISAASNFVLRIDNNSSAFHKNHPERFGKDMVQGVENRGKMYLTDIELDMKERNVKMETAINEKMDGQKADMGPLGKVVEGGSAQDYVDAEAKKTKHVEEVYGSAGKLRKPVEREVSQDDIAELVARAKLLKSIYNQRK